MRKLLIVLTLLALFLTPQIAMAQTVLTSTTLSAAVTYNATVINVTSATGFTASTGTATYYAWTNKELMEIRAVSGTRVTVIRGSGGTAAAAHANGAIIYVGLAERFYSSDPGVGSCTRTSERFMPHIVPRTGRIWECQGSLWVEANVLSPISYTLGRTAIDNVAYTALITDHVIAYTSLSTTRRLTLPSAAGMAGKELWIIDEGRAFHPTTGVFLDVSGTFLNHPGNHAMSTPAGVLHLISNGTSWTILQ